MTKDGETKVRENRVRPMAERQRLTLAKSRRLTRAFDHGRCMLVDVDTDSIVFGAPITGPNGHATLDEIEVYLTTDGGAETDGPVG